MVSLLIQKKLCVLLMMPFRATAAATVEVTAAEVTVVVVDGEADMVTMIEWVTSVVDCVQ